jgi:hypothetical protein
MIESATNGQLAMKFEASDRPDLETLIAAIARSPIVATERAFAHAALPAGFEKVDVAILRWIAADSRRAGRGNRAN